MSEIDLSEFVCNSGGANGADTEWRIIGKEFGVGKHIDFKVEHLLLPKYRLDPVKRATIESSYLKAAADLKRRIISFDWDSPINRCSYVGGLLRRDFLQVANSDAVFAIGFIIADGDKDTKGYINKTGHEIVSGGTGYAVQMAINMNKPVYVFDQNINLWTVWNYERNCFVGVNPILTKRFAGIGTREITEKGKQAIRHVFQNTIKILARD